MKPQRIQLKRAKGWRMPANTVNVARPGRWGNPFVVGKHGTAEYCIQLFEYLCAGTVAISVDNECIRAQLLFLRNTEEDIKIIQGKNLACWCHEGKPCHADVLLKIANKERKTG